MRISSSIKELLGFLWAKILWILLIGIVVGVVCVPLASLSHQNAVAQCQALQQEAEQNAAAGETDQIGTITAYYKITFDNPDMEEYGVGDVGELMFESGIPDILAERLGEPEGDVRVYANETHYSSMDSLPIMRVFHKDTTQGYFNHYMDSLLEICKEELKQATGYTMDYQKLSETFEPNEGASVTEGANELILQEPPAMRSYVRIVGSGFAAGILIAVLFFLIRDLLSPTIKGVADIRRNYGCSHIQQCKASDFARLYGDKTEIQKIGKFKTDKTFQADEPGTLLIKRYCTKHEDFCTALEALDCNIDIVVLR